MKQIPFAVLAGLLLATFTPAGENTPPTARKVPHKTELHGDVRIDDYFWMRDKANPEVIKYLEAENAYTAALLKPTEPLQQALYKDFLARIKQTDLSVPAKKHGYWYYTRTEEGKQYPIRCRKKGSLDAAEEVILDANDLARGEKFLSVGSVEISNDGRLLAFLTDTTGFREYFLSIKDLQTGKMLQSRFVKADQARWAADNKTLFYVTEDHAKRPHKLWRHTVGDPRDKDVLVAEEKDELYRLGLGKSRDGKYLYRSASSSTTTEEWFLPADKLTEVWKVIAPRKEGHEYSADHRDGLFYIRTNRDGATNFKLMTCPVGDTAPAKWKEFLPYKAAVMIQGIALFKDFGVIQEREAGNPHLRVIDFKDGKQHRVEFQEPVYSVFLGANPEFDTPTVQLTYTSLVTPSSVYEYNLADRTRKLLKRTEVPGGYNPEDYISERVFATATDGTRVPISLVFRKGVKKDGSAPLLLYGYGSYGATLPTGFDSTRLPLLDRGVIYAQAHIRGGSDMGRQWYDDGKMLKKKNTFTDFIACADFLVKEGYCNRGRLVIQGGSAGGLLVGATLNLRPDLCRAAVLQVPFVDVVNTMLDESLPLTVQEFLEWGNPKKKNEYDYIKTYCPYTNLHQAAYPALLVTTSLNDSQVLFHEPTKYVAKMRTLNPGVKVALKCNMAGGHGGSSGRYDALKEKALVLAFVLEQMGIRGSQPALDEKAVDAIVRKAMKEFEAPGVAVAVVQGDRVVYLKGHGVRELGKESPVTADTLFAIASCTKAFTATAIGFLVQEGKVRWDDPVRKHLPGFRLSDPLADRDVTIRDLLCHRTGVIRHDILWLVHPWDREEMIRRSGSLRPDKPFRSEYGYNNLQYLAAGEASSRAAGMPWEELVRSRILEPLGMKATNFSIRDLDRLRTMPSHTPGEGTRRDHSGRSLPC